LIAVSTTENFTANLQEIAAFWDGRNTPQALMPCLLN
jgi:hypothetical protein